MGRPPASIPAKTVLVGRPSGGAAWSTRRVAVTAWTTAAIAAAALVALVGQGLRVTRAQVLAQGATQVEGMARLLQDSLDATFDKVDLALQAVADEQARQASSPRPDWAAVDAAIARQLARTPDLTSLRVIDAEGRPVRGLPELPGPLSVAEDDYFLAARAGAPGMVVSRAVVGQAIKVPLIFGARRLSGPDGRFAGIVSGAVSLRHISELMTGVDVGPRGSVVLRQVDLSAVIRWIAGQVVELPRIAAPTSELRALVDAGRTSGVYEAVAPADGLVRLHAFRKLTGRPLYVVVALSRDDLLAAWSRQAVVSAALVALFLLGLGAAAWRTVRTIGSLRAAATSLAESEERLGVAFAAFPDAVTISSLETGRYLYVNEGFTRMTGWAAAEAVGQSSVDLGLWVEDADRAAVVEALVTRGAVEAYEARFRRRDGTRTTGLLTGRVVNSSGGALLLTITRDVTQQRQLEAQLQQSQRLESLGRLAGGVAHDFNNMLSVILGEAALVGDSLPPGHPAHEGIGELVRAAERSRELTRQLLAFSRRQAATPRVIDLDAQVAATRPALARLLGEDVALRHEAGPTLWPVRIDPGQVDQVLVNLAVNARDAMPDGGTLTLRTANLAVPPSPGGSPDADAPPAGDWVQLEVTDDGAGMDQEILAHVFEPFFTTKAQGKGTGLGLPTVYGIVQQNRGHVAVESAPGRGTTFRILLPRADGPVEPAPARPAAPRASPATSVATVLLVEDEALVRRTMRRMLEGLGYRVVEAATTDEAESIAADQATRLDLLLTDVVMPGVKGPELARRLRGLRPALPTVFMSGHAAQVLGDQELIDPALHFLQKPFTADALAARLREVLGEPPGTSRPAHGPPPPPAD